MSVETGLYRCEFGARVTVKRIAPDRSSLVLNWKGKDLTMRAVASQSGALRFEEAASGLVWMAIIGKSQLLDSKKGQRLANECNL
jgi:membrane-bound inhibitor of C-type lysozyme